MIVLLIVIVLLLMLIALLTLVYLRTRHTYVHTHIVTSHAPVSFNYQHQQQLAADTVTARDQVRLLGVTISADLSLDRHVSVVSATSFHSLRQLR